MNGDTYNEKQQYFSDFVKNEINPIAEQIDSTGVIPLLLIKKMSDYGFTSSQIQKEYGGKEYDARTLGLLHEEFGKGISSVENLLTVYGMAAKAITKSGNEEQKKKWLPKIVAGELIPAFAITEPSVGSDISSIETDAKEKDDFFILNGSKKWITLGQIANIFLIFAKCNGRGTTFIVEKDTPGLSIIPIPCTLGLRANMLAEIHMDNCIVPRENMLGKIGTGLTKAAKYALDEGRYTTACGSVGLAQACLEATLEYINKRVQFGVLLSQHQLVQRMVSEMIVNIKAARLICQNAGYLRDARDPASISETFAAKYYASKTATLSANYAVQIHGAVGCSKELPIERYYRDAKIMEIIEGSSELYEINIVKSSIRG
jgi:hypothetical protein